MIQNNSIQTAYKQISDTKRAPQSQTAFTLAEMLVIMGIIGVVAALTIPALMANIQGKIKEKRVQNIKQKFSKATDKMMVSSGIVGYSSTWDFVQELQKHMRIAKACDNGHLTECWPYKEILTNQDGTKTKIENLRKAVTLQMSNGDGQLWSDTVAIMTADGVPMILSYNTKCSTNQYNSPIWTGDKSNSTDCIAAVFDWNGGDRPNQYLGALDGESDIVLFGANGLGECAFKVNGRCLGNLFKPNTNFGTCYDLKDKGVLNNCIENGNNTVDYFANAIQQCGGTLDKMASASDLQQIYYQMHNNGFTESIEALGFPSDTEALYIFNNVEPGSLGMYNLASVYKMTAEKGELLQSYNYIEVAKDGRVNGRVYAMCVLNN